MHWVQAHGQRWGKDVLVSWFTTFKLKIFPAISLALQLMFCVYVRVLCVLITLSIKKQYIKNYVLLCIINVILAIINNNNNCCSSGIFYSTINSLVDF